MSVSERTHKTDAAKNDSCVPATGSGGGPLLKEHAIRYNSASAGETRGNAEFSSSERNLVQPGYFELIAAKIERDPSVLRIALENIAQWRRDNHTAPHRLDEWQRLIVASERGVAGRTELLRVLRSTDAASVRLKEFNPFAGLLTREERRHARELCGYRH